VNLRLALTLPLDNQLLHVVTVRGVCERLVGMTKERSTHTIMVVEDYDDTRMLLKVGLEGLGYSVLEAANGQEAVDIASRERPDLILMDLDLPILDGIAATQCIRQQAELEKVPIVAVTAYPMSYTHVKAFAKGCDEYMAKPIDMAELALLVNRYLRPEPVI
jgi:two-component system, cell cycle response regulator DivK